MQLVAVAGGAEVGLQTAGGQRDVIGVDGATDLGDGPPAVGGLDREIDRLGGHSQVLQGQSFV